MHRIIDIILGLIMTAFVIAFLGGMGVVLVSVFNTLGR